MKKVYAMLILTVALALGLCSVAYAENGSIDPTVMVMRTIQPE